MAEKQSDRHKPARMVRLRHRLAKQGDILAERLATDVTQLVNDAFRERLEREGLWPPPGDEHQESRPRKRGS